MSFKKSQCQAAVIKFQTLSAVDNSPHHSFCACTSTLSMYTALGSRCLAFQGTIAQRPLNKIVCNIYQGEYFHSVFMYRKSFSLHYHAEWSAGVEGKEGKYSVFMSRLSMQLLGSAGSSFCLIKGWLMSRATKVDGRIGRKKETETFRASAISASSSHMDMLQSPRLVFPKSWFPHLFFPLWQEEEQLNVASFSHT